MGKEDRDLLGKKQGWTKQIVADAFGPAQRKREIEIPKIWTKKEGALRIWRDTIGVCDLGRLTTRRGINHT